MNKETIEDIAKLSYITYYNSNDVDGLVEEHPHHFEEHYIDGFKAGWEANPVNKQVELFEQFIKEKHLSIAYYNWLEEKKDKS